MPWGTENQPVSRSRIRAVAERATPSRRSANTWRQLYDSVLEVHDGNISSLTARGLTGAEIKALLKMRVGEQVAMRALSKRWNSDASTATWLVDRLEAKGLVQRGTDPEDRRVRTVALTAAGERQLIAADERLNEPPEWWKRLGRADRERIAKLLGR